MPDTIRARVGRTVVEVKQTLLDRAIGYVSPAAGLARMRARFVTAFAEAGGYSGIPKKRRQLSQWQPSDGDADADILPDVEALREATADLSRNNAIAAGAIKTKLTSIIGAGLTLNSTVDRDVLKLTDQQADELELALQREFAIFGSTAECDLERQSNFAQMTKIVLRGMLERGDIFALLPMVERPGSPYETKVQLVEADRVTNPDFNEDTETIAGGIERDSSGAFIAIHVTDKHPGSVKSVTPRIRGSRAPRRKSDFTWSRVEAFGAETGSRNVLHVFDKQRPGQSRGVPDLAAIIEPIKQLGRYTEAEITAAVVSGMFTVFVKSEGGTGLQPMQPTGESGATEADADYKLMAGGIVGLLPGEDVTAPNPGRPNEKFDPFVQAVMIQIGMALELPYELLVKRFTSSYSAARAAINEAWKYFQVMRAVIRDLWCQPVYEAVIEEAILKGRIAAPGFMDDPAIRHAYLGAVWVGPGRGQINEVQEVDAAIKRVEANLSTKAQETAALNGGDFETNVRARRREMAAEADLVAQNRANNAPPEDPEDPDDEDDDGEERDPGEPRIPEPDQPAKD